MTGIDAKKTSTGKNITIGKNSIIKADEVTLGNNVTIGDGVEIICDTLNLAEGCVIGNSTSLLSPEITFGMGCRLGNAVSAELNEYIRLGNYCSIGNRVKVAGQGISAGTFLWLKDDVIIGGGGSAGPRSYLKMADKVSVFDKSYINLSEEVEIGEGTALSFNVVLITHGAWQPALMGFPAKFAPIKIGAHSVVYLNSVVLPGITIGDYTTIAACSLVNKDIPSNTLAGGNPVEILKRDYPPALNKQDIDELMRSILADYATTLHSKGITVLRLNNNEATCTLELSCENTGYSLRYFNTTHQVSESGATDVSIAYDILPGALHGRTHFDLQHMSVVGMPDEIAEDFRDYLRRRSIKIFTDKPFRTLPLSNLKRIKEKRKNGESK
jgi:acetyltransferase-like isoleucine patch superfamily enzyme